MQVITLDCETFPIQDGLAAPAPVCFGWARFDEGELLESGLVTDNDEYCGDLPDGVVGEVSLSSVFRALAEYALSLGPDLCRFVNTNMVYDFGVLAAQDESLLQLIFDMYDAGIVEDPALRDQLIDIAKGSLGWSSEKTAKGTNKRKNYDHKEMTKRYTGKDLDKVTYRMGYGKLSKVPLSKWSQGAIDYGIDDAITAGEIWFAQRAVVQREGGEDGEVPDSRNQAKYHWGLHLMSVWGLRTDPKMVFSFKRYLERAYSDLQPVLNSVGLLKTTGVRRPKISKNMKAVKETIVALSADREVEPRMTVPKAGSKAAPSISTKAEHIEDLLGLFTVEIPQDLTEALLLAKITMLQSVGIARPRNEADTPVKDRLSITDTYKSMMQDLGAEEYTADGLPVWNKDVDAYCRANTGQVAAEVFDGLTLFAWYTSVQKLLGTYIPPLERGTRRPINVKYNCLMETGRTSASGPNIQNLPKATGVRECYVPRKGFGFCSTDYEVLELHCLAEVCLELLGESALAEALNSGVDPHLLLACEWLMDGVSYEDGVRIREDRNHPRHKEVNKARNIAKCFHPDTEFLTRSGWKRFAELLDGEEIMQATPQKGAPPKLSWTVPTNLFSKSATSLVHLKSEGIDLRVTDDHRMLYCDDHGNPGVCTPLELGAKRGFWSTGEVATPEGLQESLGAWGCGVLRNLLTLSPGENIETTREEYDGEVVCLSVESSFVVVRDGGIPVIAGQCANFGLPGGLGAQRFVEFCKGAGIIITLKEAKQLKEAWLRQWPEMRRYFALISAQLGVDEDGLEGLSLEQIYSSRIRGKVKYTAACNSFFQGLAADGAKDANYEICKACYLPGGSLYGSRLVAFIHDETIMEHPYFGDSLESRQEFHRRCFEQARIMVESMKKFCKRVRPKAVPAAMLRWYKEAKAEYDSDGLISFWEPKEAVVWD